MSRPCSFDGCTRPHHCHGWCSLHWERVRSHGDPSVVELPGGAPHGPDDPSCTCRFNGVCCCLTAEQAADYLTGDNARWLSDLPAAERSAS